jgi:hypothetical protein
MVVITYKTEDNTSSLQNHNEEQLVATDIKAIPWNYHISLQLLAQCHATWLDNPMLTQDHTKIGTQRVLERNSGLGPTEEHVLFHYVYRSTDVSIKQTLSGKIIRINDAFIFNTQILLKNSHIKLLLFSEM